MFKTIYLTKNKQKKYALTDTKLGLFSSDSAKFKTYYASLFWSLRFIAPMDLLKLCSDVSFQNCEQLET